MKQQSFIAKTPKHELEVEVLSKLVSRDVFDVKKEQFRKMCEDGCSNYGKKYSCPPFSPSFEKFQNSFENFLVVMYSINLNQLANFDYSDYQKLQIGNAVIKPRLEKYMRSLENKTNTQFFSTGACRLCKPCKGKLGEPCAKPNDKRYSLEASGVDCNKLAMDVFDRPLLWYKNKTAPEYTSVIAAIPVSETFSF
ncbi:DUF2284 domain-containing protein [Candidatus Woesearchaeota archaeon]|nr:DUF2284 domain-containing protein [Candidatus Woesearchaeota archaeon]